MLRLLLAGCLLLAGLYASADVPVPPLAARVTDLTGTLTSEQRGALERSLAAFEAKKGSQIAVLVVASTRPEEIEQYSMRVVEQWKLGRSKVDDGLLVLVAKNEQRIRIEVGYALEGVIPDSVAKRVIRESMAPHMVAGDFYGGIREGVEQLMRLAEGEKLPAPRRASSHATPGGDWESWLVPGLLLVLVGGGMLTAVFGRLFGSLVTGALIALVAWLVAGMLAAIAAGLIAFIVTLLRGAMGTSGPGFGGRGGWSSGGWSAGGWSAGGWSSGGGSWGGGGGSWSGGGGGFGGGGASGGWGGNN